MHDWAHGRRSASFAAGSQFGGSEWRKQQAELYCSFSGCSGGYVGARSTESGEVQAGAGGVVIVHTPSIRRHHRSLGAPWTLETYRTVFTVDLHWDGQVALNLELYTRINESGDIRV